mmetsp:Transcript_5442/g.9934  ORF Transcript_5442/g.9934 Transcript_5442/m.9934 type:complete len:124 (+) Transcript_5442:128-499(+)|eukprot:CAMPEP_0201606944 /NCGR_PEP_ID=MMETSP0492-20130828/6237_1 /ASSEMBLY_ACC=CAM_ASM_000837 /TAXON_ID=420259 /ORGANISM="Thalassiosira gravida, Strain GMp14c1" /LENGTH=123 /DNA_ID=CAMNT_0048071461 /DNA_START=126 /DNA_END=500 /DNA_ORIENTATION=+
MKLLALFALVSASSTSAFVAPRPAAPQNSALQAAPTNIEKLTNAATVAAATITTVVLASPLAAIAEDVEDDYVYGNVSAPGGIGLAVGLGVVAILTAAVPVVLAPGEDAYNEMKERDSDKWGR